MTTEILFGGLDESETYRLMVINGVSLHIPESQIKELLNGNISSNANAPLSRMPEGKLCSTLSPKGSIKLTLNQEDIDRARKDYNNRTALTRNM